MTKMGAEDFVKAHSTYKGTALALQLLLAREMDASGQEWHFTSRESLMAELDCTYSGIYNAEKRMVANGDLEIRVDSGGWPRIRSYRLILPHLGNSDGGGEASATTGGESAGTAIPGSAQGWVRLNSPYRRIMLALQLLLAREMDASGQEWHFTSRESLMAELDCTYSGIYNAEKRMVANGDLEIRVEFDREWPYCRGYRLLLPASLDFTESAESERAQVPQLTRFEAARRLLAQTVSAPVPTANRNTTNWIWANSLLPQSSFLVHLTLAHLCERTGRDVISISDTELACLSRSSDDLVRQAVLEMVQRGLIEVGGDGSRKQYRLLTPGVDSSVRAEPRRSRTPRRTRPSAFPDNGILADGFYAWALRNSPYTGLRLSIHLIMAAIADGAQAQQTSNGSGSAPNGRVQLSDVDIAAKAGCSVLAMRRVKSGMIDDGLLEVINDSRGHNAFNTYRLLMPESEAAVRIGA